VGGVVRRSGISRWSSAAGPDAGLLMQDKDFGMALISAICVG
jgi:hypothetical protein